MPDTKRKRGRPKGSRTRNRKTRLPEVPAIPVNLPEPEILQADPSPNLNSGTGPSSNSETFAADVAAVIADAGAETPTSPGSAPADAPQGPQPVEFEVGGVQVSIKPESVGYVLGKLSKALASKFKDDEWALEEWELELWVPAFQIQLNKLPELLKRSGSPELALFATALAAYGINRMHKIIPLVMGSRRVETVSNADKVSSEPGTQTAASAASAPTSATPAAEKPIARSLTLARPAGASFSIPQPTSGPES